MIEDQTYLIDTTYRQFFSTVRANPGRYNTTDEILKIPTAPDPGYFVKDEPFARVLLEKGYVPLTKETAKSYGKAFDLSGRLTEEEITNANKDYYQLILTNSSTYSIPLEELDEFSKSFPGEKSRAIW